ncbi:HET-domain-containing protein [Phaeosphaeriaceae sp. SRC1lsM3a]|nr:HET-domain-containing protein [Stagonospora sp. SRC1lsM3a]
MYTYESLADPEGEIRLAILQPGAFSDPICITFRRCHLEDDRPDYEALSYAWGSAADPSVVYIDAITRAPLAITRNLDTALRHLRHEAQSRTMWVDALCIDQESTHEKNHQVASMGQIYSSAACVVIWLGLEQDRSDNALDFVEHISSCVEVNFEMLTLQPSEHCDESERHFGDLRVALPFKNSALDPVLHLLERPYFKRVWIRQEIALASHAVLYCGDRRVNIQDFRKAVACLIYKGYKASSVSDGLSLLLNKARLQVYYLCTVVPGTCTWSQFRVYLGDAQCQDPRDRIYALLCFLRPSEPLNDLKPDYSITTEQLYTHVASRIIIQQQSLKLLDSCYLTSRTLNIPSWAPDWTSLLPQATLNTQWSACGWITSDCSIIDKSRLSVTGTLVSYIEEVLEHNLQLEGSSYDGCKTLVNTFRRLTPSEEELEVRKWSRRQWSRMLCSVVASFRFQDASDPSDETVLKFHHYVDVVETICFTEAKAEELLEREDLKMKLILHIFRHAWLGFVFVKCSDGRIGFAYPGVRRGDLISVLLGCQYPLILRPCPFDGADVTKLWEVVCVAMIGDLMEGQAIYGCGEMSQRRAVRLRLEEIELQHIIDGQTLGMYDEKSRKLSTNPAEILTEMGIKVESYQRFPHRLQVLPETLRAVGVDLQEFILV